MSKKINLTFPDGNSRAFPVGTTGIQIAQSISQGLARNALAIEVNGELFDVSRTIETNATIKICTWQDEGGKYAYWHSSAHLLAEALEALYPGVKFGIGPPIEKGFYYDVDLGNHPFGEEDLPKIENKMKELAKANSIFERRAVSKSEALSYFTTKNDEYKIELINGLEDGTITFYKQGNFTDLCRGPHVPNTGFIKAIKLTSVAGAYWRGNEKNKMLTRIYGITFPKQTELDEYLTLLEEAKKRDHRKLGRELDLFTFSESVGMGLPLWLPKGTIVRERLEQFMRRAQVRSGYDPVITPHIGGKALYMTSGHYEKYGQDSFQPIHTPNEGEEFLLKPMNCPHHCEIYKSRMRSYRDLPLRLCEFGTVYRYEQSGELHGLTRVRGFTQDDAHIFCREDQVKDEFVKVIDLVMHVFKSLGFEKYTTQVSLRDPDLPEKYIGSPELWDRAERELQEAVKERNLNTITVKGEAAFYGPKLDFMVKDALDRSWQLGTIQVDYNLPERFQLEYVGANNARLRPVMIHRAPFGSLERFVAVLLEHCAGNLPLWLMPDQVAVLPISDRFHNYAQEVIQQIKEKDIRGYLDDRDEKIGRKIRDAEVKKVPLMLIVGDKEASSETVAVRQHGEGDKGSMTLKDFITQYQSLFNMPE